MEMMGNQRNTLAWHAVRHASVHVRLAALTVRSVPLAECTVSGADRMNYSSQPADLVFL